VIFPDWQALWREAPAWGAIGPRVSEPALARHGNFDRWRAALATLPAVEVREVHLGSTVSAHGAPGPVERRRLERGLAAFHPWRKGPWDICGVRIDTEWRSDWKWRRLEPHLRTLAGERVLDVGCGNGYFGWRLVGAGAMRVIGVDPTLVYFFQHLAVSRYLGAGANWILPLRFEELPITEFDVVMSMGVVYHRRDPLAHVERLLEFTRPGGRIVLESLVVEDGEDLRPADRYARMRNVHVVPRTETLASWLTAAGAEDVRIVDVTPTTIEEQHTTPWMRFESLPEALDPADPRRTVEGLPAPVRAIVLARRPG